jgi:hypothetical protein
MAGGYEQIYRREMGAHRHAAGSASLTFAPTVLGLPGGLTEIQGTRRAP